MITSASSNNNLKEAFALWEKEKNGKVYYSGKTSEDKPINIIAFVNKDKKNPKQPDINVYESKEKGEEKNEIAILWESKSKAGKIYYNGFTNEKEPIVAFINGDTKDGKYPKIRVYFKSETK